MEKKLESILERLRVVEIIYIQLVKKTKHIKYLENLIEEISIKLAKYECRKSQTTAEGKSCLKNRYQKFMKKLGGVK